MPHRSTRAAELTKEAALPSRLEKHACRRTGGPVTACIETSNRQVPRTCAAAVMCADAPLQKTTTCAHVQVTTVHLAGAKSAWLAVLCNTVRGQVLLSSSVWSTL